MKRVLVETLYECGNRQNVGRLPGCGSAGSLGLVELALEFRRETPVRSDYGDASFETGDKIRENIGEMNARKFRNGGHAAASRCGSTFQLVQFLCYFCPIVSIGESIFLFDDRFPDFG